MPDTNGDEKAKPAEPGKVFGQVLKAQRRARRLTQDELAERSGCHRAHVSFIERELRSPTLDMLFQLADGLGISASELIVEVEVSLGRRSPEDRL